MFNRIERQAEIVSGPRSETGLIVRVRRASASWSRAHRMAPVMILLAIALFAAPASADRYNRDEAGHPLRIVAYIIHPIGVVLDYLILRPGHWLVSQEPMRTLFGHED